MAVSATAAFAVSAAHGQETAPRGTRIPPGAVVQPLPSDDGEALRRNLTALAANPRSADALVGAGRAALELGDVEAALSFFGRAVELSPSDSRAKAGMASALVRMGRAETALSLFAEAASLGAPEAEIAGDRALAFDMVGDTRRAQQEYVRSLRHRDDPEVRRRLALSLAISGEREAALRAIDSQLRGDQRAAWRTQAFVLALTGDGPGANRTAQRMMLPDDARAMAPFFARLRSLTPAQKAKAVHLGLFPSNGGGAVGGRAPGSADPNAVALAMGRAPSGPAGRPSTAEPVEPRRRLGMSNDPSGLERYSRMAQRQLELAEADPPTVGTTRWAGAASESIGSPAGNQPTPDPNVETPIRDAVAAASQSPARNPRAAPPAAAASADPSASRPDGPSASGAALPGQLSSSPSTANPAPIRVASAAPLLAGPRAVELPPSSVATVRSEPSAAPGFSLSPAGSLPAASGAAASSLADIAAVVRSLPVEEEAEDEPASPPAAERRSARAATTTRAAQLRHPARIWVQIAGGANRAALPREFARLREMAPRQLGRRAAYAAPLRATNRLLVGPFESQDEAQAFVNQLAEQDVAAFAWTSEAGQEIERLQTR